MVAKGGAGRRYWVVRFRAQEERQRRLRSIYIGRDVEQELLARTKRLLEEIRAPARLLREITNPDYSSV